VYNRTAIGVEKETEGIRERVWVPGLSARVWPWEMKYRTWRGRVVRHGWNVEEGRWEVTVQVQELTVQGRWFLEVVPGGLAGA